jgi:hypothetical protein
MVSVCAEATTGIITAKSRPLALALTPIQPIHALTRQQLAKRTAEVFIQRRPVEAAGLAQDVLVQSARSASRVGAYCVKTRLLTPRR